jgi:hypothetical protein
VPRNEHRGPPSVQSQATLFALLFGRIAGCFFGRHALGVCGCLRCKLGLLRSGALFAQSCFLTLQCSDYSRGGDGLALVSFFDGHRPLRVDKNSFAPFVAPLVGDYPDVGKPASAFWAVCGPIG